MLNLSLYSKSIFFHWRDTLLPTNQGLKTMPFIWSQFSSISIKHDQPWGREESIVLTQNYCSQMSNLCNFSFDKMKGLCICTMSIFQVHHNIKSHMWTQLLTHWCDLLQSLWPHLMKKKKGFFMFFFNLMENKFTQSRV